MTGRDLRLVRLAGRWATDNAGRIRVNGQDTAFTTGVAQFNIWTPFALDPTTAPLVRGTNIIDFVVNNAGGAGNPTGLRVEFTDVTAPEDGFRLLTSSTFLRPALAIRQIINSPSDRFVQLNWSPVSACYRLQAAPAVTGPWTDVPGATSGLTLRPTPARQFFRLVQ